MRTPLLTRLVRAAGRPRRHGPAVRVAGLHEWAARPPRLRAHLRGTARCASSAPSASAASTYWPPIHLPSPTRYAVVAERHGHPRGRDPLRRLLRRMAVLLAVVLAVAARLGSRGAPSRHSSARATSGRRRAAFLTVISVLSICGVARQLVRALERRQRDGRLQRKT